MFVYTYLKKSTNFISLDEIIYLFKLLRVLLTKIIVNITFNFKTPHKLEHIYIYFPTKTTINKEWGEYQFTYIR